HRASSSLLRYVEVPTHTGPAIARVRGAQATVGLEDPALLWDPRDAYGSDAAAMQPKRGLRRRDLHRRRRHHKGLKVALTAWTDSVPWHLCLPPVAGPASAVARHLADLCIHPAL